MSVRRLALQAAGCGAVVAAGWAVLDRRGPTVGPVAEFPAHIDLGDRQPNEAVTATLPLANPGDRELVVSDIDTSCSCAGLEVEQDGRPARVTGLTLPPGDRIDLTFRLAVGVPPGQGQQVLIRFNTNDPKVPAARVIATVPRVVGRPSAVPAEVAFGAVALGRPAAERFAVRANAVPGLRVVRVASSRPDRFTAAEAPAEADAVAGVRVELATASPGEVAGEVTVELAAADGTPHTVRVPVSGRVRRPVEPAPAHLLLPAGRETATAFLVGASEEPFTAAVVGTPAGLTAALEAEPPLAGRFQVKLVVNRAAGTAPATGPVRLTVTPGSGAAFPLEVPVSCPARS